MEPTLDDVLDAMHEELDRPLVLRVASWCIRYPEHRDAIIEHAQGWFVQEVYVALGCEIGSNPDEVSPASRGSCEV
jgi:hypothetical protein